MLSSVCIPYHGLLPMFQVKSVPQLLGTSTTQAPNSLGHTPSPQTDWNTDSKPQQIYRAATEGYRSRIPSCYRGIPIPYTELLPIDTERGYRATTERYRKITKRKYSLNNSGYCSEAVVQHPTAG